MAADATRGSLTVMSILEPLTTAALPLPAAVLPDHGAYDDARAAWNLTADQRPAAIVTAKSPADVVGAIDLARVHGLQVAAQGTGHLAPALPSLDRALLLRTRIGGVEVDVAARRARVGAGAVWSDVVAAAAPHGLAPLSGSAHDVGVVGYVLGGGVSWLARREGLACNHVHAIELVDAEGRLVRATATEHPELFWALRGGGGNFGVVTHVEIGLLELDRVVAGMTVWPAAQAREVLAAWVAWSRTADEAVTTSLRMMVVPPMPGVPPALHGQAVLMVDGAVTASPEIADALLAGFREIGEPLVDTWGPMGADGLLDLHLDPPGPVPAIGDTLTLGDLDGAGIDAVLAAADPQRNPGILELRQLGGALGRPADGAGACARLPGSFLLFGVGLVTGPQEAGRIRRCLAALVDDLAPWEDGPRYLNFAEGGGSAAGTFDAATYSRLVAIRSAWDPQERFLASHHVATS